MSDKPVRLATKIWLAACLVTLAVALVPVFAPNASLHGRYATPHTDRLKRHSFLNVAEGRPDARLSKISHETMPFALLSLIGPVLDPWPLVSPISSAPPLLRVLPHRRKLGRADPGDPDPVVQALQS